MNIFLVGFCKIESERDKTWVWMLICPYDAAVLFKNSSAVCVSSEGIPVKFFDTSKWIFRFKTCLSSFTIIKSIIGVTYSTRSFVPLCNLGLSKNLNQSDCKDA